MTLNMELHWRAWRAEQNRPALTGEGGAGLLVVLTGHGKGKSTAAFGMAWRAVTRQIKVGVVQFMGGAHPSIELQTLGRQPLCEFKVFGVGGHQPHPLRAADKAQAIAAWLEVKRMLADPAIGMVICDDIFPLIHDQLLDLDVVLAELKRRRRDVHLILTGRHAPYELMDKADLVTNMRQMAYPPLTTPAQAGIEF